MTYDNDALCSFVENSENYASIVFVVTILANSKIKWRFDDDFAYKKEINTYPHLGVI